MPDNLKNKNYYTPKETSQYERQLKQIKDHLDKLFKASKQSFFIVNINVFCYNKTVLWGY